MTSPFLLKLGSSEGLKGAWLSIGNNRNRFAISSLNAQIVLSEYRSIIEEHRQQHQICICTASPPLIRQSR